MSTSTHSRRLCHDHLDDLESFFYVLCWICFGFSGPRKKFDPLPKTLQKWESTDPESAADAKQSMLFKRLSWAGVCTPFFGDIFQELLQDLHGFFAEQVGRKLDSITQQDALPIAKQTLPSLPDLIPESSQHYDRFGLRRQRDQKARRSAAKFSRCRRYSSNRGSHHFHESALHTPTHNLSLFPPGDAIERAANKCPRISHHPQAEL